MAGRPTRLEEGHVLPAAQPRTPMPPVASRGGSHSLAVTDELDRAQKAQPLQDSIRAWRDANPFPPPTGLKADEAFFDELSGEP